MLKSWYYLAAAAAAETRATVAVVGYADWPVVAAVEAAPMSLMVRATAAAAAAAFVAVAAISEAIEIEGAGLRDPVGATAAIVTAAVIFEQDSVATTAAKNFATVSADYASARDSVALLVAEVVGLEARMME